MPTIPGAPTAGAQQQAGMSLAGADRMRGGRFDLRMRTAQNLKMQRDRLVQMLKQKKAERESERAEREAEGGGMGGAIGAGAGMALGYVLAPFTGGASLAVMGAMTAVGGGIGTAIEGGPGSEARATQMIVGGATEIGGAFTQNPYYSGYEPSAWLNQTVETYDPAGHYGSAPGGAMGFR